MTALARPAPQRAAGAPPRSRASIVLYVLLTLGLVLMIAPFVWMVLGSFKAQGEFLRLPPTWLPEAAHVQQLSSASSTNWTCRASSSTRSSSRSP